MGLSPQLLLSEGLEQAAVVVGPHGSAELTIVGFGIRSDKFKAMCKTAHCTRNEKKNISPGGWAKITISIFLKLESGTCHLGQQSVGSYDTPWTGKEEPTMLKAVKESVHRMASHLQLISAYLEMEDYAKALGKTRETIKELRALATSLTGLTNVAMTVPKDGAVVVPHGSTVVSYEDVNVDVDSDEVRSVDKNEVRAGRGSDNPKTK